MTPEEMVSRLLYRDGLMLVLDKPPGFAVHRGPKGGESLEDHFDALRFGPPSQGAGAARQTVQVRRHRQDLLGGGRGIARN
jgi:tRNA pseudouridine32 synthase/23S rRNA pseudouridine746 synthase